MAATSFVFSLQAPSGARKRGFPHIKTDGWRTPLKVLHTKIRHAASHSTGVNAWARKRPLADDGRKRRLLVEFVAWEATRFGQRNRLLGGTIMLISKRVPLLLLAASLVTVIACVASHHPLSDEKNSIVDERLIGSWVDESGDVFQVKRGDAKKNHLDVGFRTKDKEGVDKLLLFTTTLHDNRYMSVKFLDEEKQKDQQEAYFIYQYRLLDNNTLEIRTMKAQAIKNAIADKDLAGKVVKSSRIPIFDTLITDSSESIARYLKAHADECYPAKSDSIVIMTFKRRM